MYQSETHGDKALSKAARAKIIYRLVLVCIGAYVLLPLIAYWNHHLHKIHIVVAVVGIIFALLSLYLGLTRISKLRI